MYTTNPSQGERHFLYILLHHIQGAIDYDGLKTGPDGVIHETFKQAVIASGLLDSDDEWNECLKEVATAFMPKQLHSLFLTILLFGESAKPQLLSDKSKDMMGQDVLRDAVMSQNTTKEQLMLKVDNEVFLLLEYELLAMDKCLADFNLPTPDRVLRIETIPWVIQDQMFDVDAQKELSKIKSKRLNVDQEVVFSTIVKAVCDETHTQKLFFLNAPGSYGKHV